MKLSVMAGIAAGLCLSIFLTGCGDVYRPVVNPFTQPGGDPQNSRTAYVINEGVVQPTLPTSGAVPSACDTAPCPGASTQVDVTGDTNMGNHQVGRTPWHLFANFGLLWVANRDDNSLSSVTSTGQTVVSLPAASAPNFLATTQTDQLFVSLPGTDVTVPGNVGVISLGTSTLSQTIPVGRNPVALVETPDQKQLYAVNKNDGTVTVIATLDKKILGTIRVGTAPVWAIATADSKFIFVLNRGSNTVSVLSTADNTTELGEISVGTSADVTNIPLTNPMFYDSRQQRLYVTNSTDGTLSMFDVSALPTLPTPLSASPLALAAQGTPSPNPVSVAALADGSRVYVANAATGTVSVIDARSLTVKKTIPVGANTVAIAASPESTKVYAVSRDSTVQPGSNSPVLTGRPGTSVIRTSDDTLTSNIDAPFQDTVNCVADQPQPWVASTVFTLGNFIVPTVSNGHLFRATTAGTSGATQPTWCTTSGCTVTDGTVVWTEVGSTALFSQYCVRQKPWSVSMF